MTTDNVVRDWSVEIITEGRSGHVLYRENAHELKCYWELMTGDTVASVYLGTIEEWSTFESWCRLRRGEIAERIAREIIRQRAPGSSYVIDSQAGYLDFLARPVI